MSLALQAMEVTPEPLGNTSMRHYLQSDCTGKLLASGAFNQNSMILMHVQITACTRTAQILLCVHEEFLCI